MKLALLLLVQGLAGLCSAQCHIEANPNPSKSLICSQRGSVTPKVRKYATYVAPSRQFCTDTCFRSHDCASFSYSRLNQTCSYYYDTIGDQDFRADRKSPLVFSNSRCFRWGSECQAFANAAFEGLTADAVPVKKYLPFNREVKLAPWTLQRVGGRYQTYAYLAKPGRLPAGASPSPDGGNFAVVQLDSDDWAFFDQYVNLQGTTQYRMTFQYSFINYTSSVPPDPNASYLIYVVCKRNFGVTNYVTLYPTNQSVVNGEWHQFDMSFLTPDKKNNETSQSCGIFLSSTGNVTQSRAIFGFDSISLSPETTAK